MADPFVSVSGGVCCVPSTETVTVPVGVVVLEADPEATVMLMASLAPAAGVLLAAETVVFEATGAGWTTLIETVPGVVEAAPLLSVALNVKLSGPT